MLVKKVIYIGKRSILHVKKVICLCQKIDNHVKKMIIFKWHENCNKIGIKFLTGKNAKSVPSGAKFALFCVI